MSSKVEVLCPNGHRVYVKTNSNTKLVKILEEACNKKGFQDSEYQLCHAQSRKILDLTLTVRFAGLPNNAKLEMVKAAQPRIEGKVTIAVQTSSGVRIKGEFNPSHTLYAVLQNLEKENSEKLIEPESREESLLQPVCVYLREEIIGEHALRETTLKDLGLLSGSGIIRLVHKPVEESTLKEISDKISKDKAKQMKMTVPVSTPSQPAMEHALNDIDEEVMETTEPGKPQMTESMDTNEDTSTNMNHSSANTPIVSNEEHSHVAPAAGFNAEQMMLFAQSLIPSIFPPDPPRQDVRPRQQQQQNYGPPLRLQQQPVFTDFKFPEATKGQNLYSNELSCEREIIKHTPCSRDIVCYNIDDIRTSSAVPVEPDEEFFELSVSDVKKMYAELQQKLHQDTDLPLMTQAMRKAEAEERLSKYDHVFIRFTFPDKMVLQATFRPKEPVYNMYKFVKEYLKDKNVSFYLFTSPPKKVLEDKSETLVEAELVPMTVVYVGSASGVELSESVRAESATQLLANQKIVETVNRPIKRQANSDQVAKNSRKIESQPRQQPSTSAGDPKVPKWFKIGNK